jgi:phage repressor protein C with HTH and peptisase S24 domain
MSEHGTVMVVILADIGQGAIAQQNGQRVELPTALVDPHDVLYRVIDGSLGPMGANPGDLLIVEPKETASTGELVLAEKRGKVYVGRYWAKHGRRDVVGDGDDVIVRAAKIVGAVTLIVRGIA